MGAKPAHADEVIARVATAQHGVVTRRQLLDAGLGRGAIRRRLESGHLRNVHRGVYAVGHDGLSQEGLWLAAVLAVGPDAVLSHLSAVVLWELLRPVDGSVDVSLPGRNGRAPRAGIRIHRRTHLLASDVTLRRRVPVTTPARTIADLRPVLAPPLLRRAIRQAELRGYRLDAPGDRTRSDLELDFLAFCSRHGIPRPEVNVEVGPWTVDFLWPVARLAVETDFYAYHRGTVAFEDDHRRDLDLRRRGYTVRRYTGAQIRDHPAAVVADLREVLRRPPAAPAS